MAKDCSFDIVSEFDRQELVNAVDQVKRDVASRFDLKDSGSEIDLDADKEIVVTTKDDMKLRNIYDILQSKISKRGLNIRILDPQPVENALGGNVRQVYKLKKGLTQELAKKIVADIKDLKIKVQASIQGDQVRVSGKDKDDLQAVIKALRENEAKYDYPLQFTNYR
ncbi:MAG: YajQ family cyclic di-GMP-binding protein [Fusobacterium sp.]|nr:YajQ family cyclic di-GMP-binding protein [Fusobacterium sp.]